MPRYQKAGHESSPSRSLANISTESSQCHESLSVNFPMGATPYDPYHYDNVTLRCIRESLDDSNADKAQSTYANVPRSPLRNDGFGETIVQDEIMFRKPQMGRGSGENLVPVPVIVTSSLAGNRTPNVRGTIIRLYVNFLSRYSLFSLPN